LQTNTGSVHVERHHVEGISVDILPVGKEPFQTQKLAQMHNHWGRGRPAPTLDFHKLAS